MKKFIKKIYSKKFSLVNNFSYDRTKIRNSTILPNNIGKKFYIHNGKTYNKLSITKEMVGYKFGEFIRTRKPFNFSN